MPSNQDPDDWRDQAVDREWEELIKNPPALIVTSASISEIFLAIQPDEKSRQEAQALIASQAGSVQPLAAPDHAQGHHH